MFVGLLGILLFLALIVIGVLFLVLVIGSLVLFLPATIISVVVLLLTGSWFYTGVAFLVVALLMILLK